MKISGICFTQEGSKVLQRIARIFSHREEDHECRWYRKGKYLSDGGDFSMENVKESVQEWAGSRFDKDDAMIFVGAAGIAVRAIAPYVRDKRTDPAVIVLDERGRFCISLLSGHIGGANALVKDIALILNSVPVITTATDVSNRFAVDVFATENHMEISNMTYAKEVSAALLDGEPVGFYTNFPVEGELPKGIYWSEKLKQAEDDFVFNREATTVGIYISPSYSRSYFDHTLWLIPRCLSVGIGCKKGTSVQTIRKVAAKVFRQYSLYPEAIASVSSIDLKKDEEGLLAYCEELGIPLQTYTAEELLQAEGEFTPSSFVQSITGVDNVCERSAVIGGRRTLIVPKTAEDGVTVAVALIDTVIRF
ncbi:MAG: cobalt-precorrin 5A hydrolase [Eubacteriales bacterium]|nr:cobalt-precorrin 5A hydrolase [Eubacteriales bacterium]